MITTADKCYNCWELYELPTDMDKLDEVIEVFNEIADDIKESNGLTLHANPHVMIRAAQSPLEIGEIKEAVQEAVNYMAGKEHKGRVFDAWNDREELKLNRENNQGRSFVVMKDWIEEKNGRIDIVSVGLSGYRLRGDDKSEILGVTKKEFYDMNNDQKKELFEKLVAETESKEFVKMEGEMKEADSAKDMKLNESDLTQ